MLSQACYTALWKTKIHCYFEILSCYLQQITYVAVLNRYAIYIYKLNFHVNSGICFFHKKFVSVSSVDCILSYTLKLSCYLQQINSCCCLMQMLQVVIVIVDMHLTMSLGEKIHRFLQHFVLLSSIDIVYCWAYLQLILVPSFSLVSTVLTLPM